MEMTADMTRLAESVARDILRDGVASEYIEAYKNGDNEDTGNFCEAYMKAEQKKTEQMQTLFLTDSNFRKMFTDMVEGI